MINEAEKLMKGLVNDKNFSIFHNALMFITAKETINWMRQNSYLHQWLIPLNRLQDSTPYADCPVGNTPKLIPLDKLLNRDILHSLRMHIVLSRYIVDEEENTKEESNMCFSYSTPREIDRGLKCIWD